VEFGANALADAITFWGDHMAQRERLVLSGTCREHGTPGFTNFLVESSTAGVRFDPHVTDACTVSVDWEQAQALHDQLAQWLGVEVG